MPIQEVGKHADSQLKLIADVLASSKKVVVITGAGISTNCGIPVRQAVPRRRILDELLIADLGLSLGKRSL